MKAWAIVWGPDNNAVEVYLSSGNKCSAIFFEYEQAVRTLAGFKEIGDRHIIPVRITAHVA